MEKANHSLKDFKINLQLFAEGEAAPAPESSPAPEFTPEAGTPTPESTPAPQSIRVKYNHQDMDIPYEEAITHIQKGMNYDKAIERAGQESAQKARDEVYASMGWEWNGKRITTEAEYKQALQEKAIVDRLKSQYSEVPDEVVNELLEGRRFRDQYTAKEKESAEQQRKAQEEKDFASRRDSMYDEFLAEFPDYNTEEKWKSIPKEVWAEADKWLKSGGREGRRLADGLTRWNFKQTLSQQQTAQANQANAEGSTGSIKGEGAPSSGYISKATFEANKHNDSWVRNNLPDIEKSMKRW